MKKSTVVAICVRVSKTEQNPETRLLALREYADRRGFEIHKEYVDYVSGDAERRRANTRMTALIENSWRMLAVGNSIVYWFGSTIGSHGS